jgi:heme-degrading monooxygenase HmoA
MRAVSIDPFRHPEQHYRIDNFTVPADAREAFEAAMRRNVAFLETLPGFLGHVAFVKTGGPGAFDVATIAAWESAAALERAVAAVRAHYAEIGFDMRTALEQWGAAAQCGNFRAPAELQ